MLKYMGANMLVEDMARSRYFYEQLLGQKMKVDFGPNVAFEGDFSIHLRSHFEELLGDAPRYPITQKSHSCELTFESDEIEALYQRLQQARVEFMHGVQEQPWGQLVMRLYDPDGHLLEIGETMDGVIVRMYRQGVAAERIQAVTGMPLETVERLIQAQGST
jgi:catechol 2,3-dioxygenase-like lactoylglutathione lyase family enzyme